jgi:hypothetical protein
VLAVVSGIESGVNNASIGLRPDLELIQMGRQLSEIERGVDFLILYVPLNLGKLLNETLAGLIKVLTGDHSLSVRRSVGQL